MRHLFAAAALAFALASQSEAEVLIGVAGPMSGKLAWTGMQLRRGAEMAVANINAAGGVLGQQVRLIVADDFCDPRQALAAAEKLDADGAVFVIGHYWSGASIPASKGDSCRSIHLDVGVADNRGPFGKLGLDVGGELLGRRTHDLGAEFLHAFLHRWIGHGLLRSFVKPGDHRLWRIGRSEERIPGIGLVTGNARLSDGRNVRKGRCAFCRRDSERAKGASFDVTG